MSLSDALPSDSNPGLSATQVEPPVSSGELTGGSTVDPDSECKKRKKGSVPFFVLTPQPSLWYQSG